MNHPKWKVPPGENASDTSQLSLADLQPAQDKSTSPWLGQVTSHKPLLSLRVEHLCAHTGEHSTDMRQKNTKHNIKTMLATPSTGESQSSALMMCGRPKLQCDSLLPHITTGVRSNSQLRFTVCRSKVTTPQPGSKNTLT